MYLAYLLLGIHEHEPDIQIRVLGLDKTVLGTVLRLPEALDLHVYPVAQHDIRLVLVVLDVGDSERLILERDPLLQEIPHNTSLKLRPTGDVLGDRHLFDPAVLRFPGH